MNERIAELYNKAIVLDDNGDYVEGELDPEKFAELIINECAELVDTRGLSYKIDTYGKMIKLHFGVEE